MTGDAVRELIHGVSPPASGERTPQQRFLVIGVVGHHGDHHQFQACSPMQVCWCGDGGEGTLVRACMSWLTLAQAPTSRNGSHDRTATYGQKTVSPENTTISEP